jgi:hypothetical protein
MKKVECLRNISRNVSPTFLRSNPTEDIESLLKFEYDQFLKGTGTICCLILLAARAGQKPSVGSPKFAVKQTCNQANVKNKHRNYCLKVI